MDLMGAPLVEAVRRRDLEALRRGLATGADLDATDLHGGTALFWAVHLSDAAAAALLLDHGADPEAHDPARLARGVPLAHGTGLWTGLPEGAPAEPCGRPTLLHEAAAQSETRSGAAGRGDVVRLLLDRGFAVDAPDPWGCTPLHAAASSGNLAVLERLLRAGAARDAADRRGHAALDHSHLKLEVVQTLLEHGASPDGGPRLPQDEGSHGWTLLEQAAHAGRLDVVHALLAAGARLDRHPAAVNHAAWRGRNDVLRRLLDAGGRLDGRIHWRSRRAGPLECAAMSAHLACVEMLLERCRGELDVALEAAVDYATDDVGPPGTARAPERRAIVQRLLAEGGDPSRALLQAGHVPDPAYATLLVTRGADPNARDGDGDTPLHKAAWWRLPRTAEVLLRAGADPLARNVRGETVWMASQNAIAPSAEHDRGNLEALLRSAGADPGHPKRTPAAPSAQAPVTLAAGTRVRHPSFGEGTVRAVQGEGPEAKVTVEFAKKQKKVLMARFLT